MWKFETSKLFGQSFALKISQLIELETVSGFSFSFLVPLCIAFNDGLLREISKIVLQQWI